MKGINSKKLSIYCEMCSGDGWDLNKPTGEVDNNGEDLFWACGFCNGTGSIPTEFGMDLLSFLKEHLPEIWGNLKKQK